MADDRPPIPVPVPIPPKEGIASGTPPPPPVPAPITPGAITAQPMPMPPIPLDPAKPAPAPAATGKEAEHKDTFRELIETVVFVVVLVLMLKTFLAEAFVIPTGSMAVTLLGYHHKVTCQQCGYPLLVNASDEADPQGGNPRPVVSCECEGCGFVNKLDPPPQQRGGQQ